MAIAYITVAEAAKALRMTEDTIRAHCKSGAIRHKRFAGGAYRILASEIEPTNKIDNITPIRVLK